MKNQQRQYLGTRLRLLTLCLGAASLGACSMLQPAAKAPPAFYALEYAKPSVASPMPGLPGVAAPTLIISPVRAASGFDSQRIIYVREPHKIEYFAHNEWIDTPARMLGSLLVASIENTGSFRSVVLTPSAASGDLRLDTEIVRLQQEFHTKPSMVHFTLRAYLVDEKTRKVLASREFDCQLAASNDDPRAGVEAANRAVQTVLEELAQFLVQRPR